jgi:hypothetical protein
MYQIVPAKFRWIALVVAIALCMAAVWLIFSLSDDRSFTLPFSRPVVEIVPSLTNQPERCLTCHTGIESIGASHPTEKFGCVSCHEGKALATDKDTAHQELVINPGDLAVADKYCGGACHAAQTATVPKTVMATYTGAIALIRRTFGLQADGTAQYATTHIDHLKAFTVSASDPVPVQHFNTNCQSCHLRAEPIQQPYFYRSTGCSACHVLYDNDGLYKGSDPTISKNQAGHPALHEITKQIPYTQCNHCHNRGNYDLRTMSFLPRADLPAPDNLDGLRLRWHEYYQPIGQFTRCEFELDCIDCHTKNEIMGDGVIYNNRTEAQYIQCKTCHGTSDSPPQQADMSVAYPNATPQSPFSPVGSAVMMTSKGELLPKITLVNGKWILVGKVSGISYTIPMVQGTQCQQKPDEQASHYCHDCHNKGREVFPTPAP